MLPDRVSTIGASILLHTLLPNTGIMLTKLLSGVH